MLIGATDLVDALVRRRVVLEVVQTRSAAGDRASCAKIVVTRLLRSGLERCP